MIRALTRLVAGCLFAAAAAALVYVRVIVCRSPSCREEALAEAASFAFAAAAAGVALGVLEAPRRLERRRRALALRAARR
jgi:hypothetical protein